jgi:hypothetical protein
VVVGLALVGAGLGGWFAVVVALALCWLWWGRSGWLAAVLALAVALAALANARAATPPDAASPASGAVSRPG